MQNHKRLYSGKERTSVRRQEQRCTSTIALITEVRDGANEEMHGKACDEREHCEDKKKKDSNTGGVREKERENNHAQIAAQGI